MDNWCNILILLFKRISSAEIFSGKIWYDRVDRSTFSELVRTYRVHKDKGFNYSGDEARNLFLYARDSVHEETEEKEERMGIDSSERMEESENESDGIDVYRTLDKFGRLILKEIEGVPVCRYRYLLKWRMVSFELDEDLFTTSFLAGEDVKKQRQDRKDFSWKFIIGNDNVELNNMLKKGLAENHFHLKGSAPYFSLSWINLMNRVSDRSFIRKLKRYDETRLQEFTVYRTEAAERSLVLLALQAALIRGYLYACIKKKEFPILNECYMKRSGVECDLDWGQWDRRRNLLEQVERDPENIVWAVLDQCDRNDPRIEYLKRNFIFREEEIGEDWCRRRSLTEYEMVCYLWQRGKFVNVTWDFIRLFVKNERREELRKKAEYWNMERALGDSDTLFLLRDELQMLLNDFREGGRKYDYMGEPGEEENLYGERWFLYKMFRMIREQTPGMQKNFNLFYGYLIIKERIRSELVQVNARVGFDNFLRYQNRKEEFIEKTALEKLYNRLAVKMTLETQPIRKLEARITPKRTSEKDRKYICDLDEKIAGNDKELKERYFYVLHFVKEPDKEKKEYEDLYCRHHDLRGKVRDQAVGIQNMRLRYPKEASRVLGIDACSPEIGCRPEVFAQAYRFLRYEQIFTQENLEKRAPRLRSTYHVGEDFLDITDGMRAVEEAVYYLNLTHGDRLGHALALGISPREWYQAKRNRVLCSRQDILDNLMWIYHRIRRYNIVDTENILLKLERNFVHYYNMVYNNGRNEPCDINVYYDAWKLRGDDPYCYGGGGDVEKSMSTGWESYAYNTKYMELSQIRKEKLCTKLFYRYHFDPEVKKKGKQIVEYKIDPELIPIVEKIQRHLQREIMECGLAIETNPSSNYLIGDLLSYDRHPIINFHNKRLTEDLELLEKCPQLDVTINTDDQTVFGTSLENEYALMAVALEKARDDKGKLLYKKDRIYDWLDEIRETGLSRSFLQER